MNDPHANAIGIVTASPRSAADPVERVGFPRIYAVAKWSIVIALVVLSLAAAAFWTMIFSGFAGSGFRAPQALDRAGGVPEITAECAWPLGIHDADAKSVCRMFDNLTPEQRTQVLRTRK